MFFFKCIGVVWFVWHRIILYMDMYVCAPRLLYSAMVTATTVTVTYL